MTRALARWKAEVACSHAGEAASADVDRREQALHGEHAEVAEQPRGPRTACQELPHARVAVGPRPRDARQRRAGAPRRPGELDPARESVRHRRLQRDRPQHGIDERGPGCSARASAEPVMLMKITWSVPSVPLWWRVCSPSELEASSASASPRRRPRVGATTASAATIRAQCSAVVTGGRATTSTPGRCAEGGCAACAS